MVKWQGMKKCSRKSDEAAGSGEVCALCAQFCEWRMQVRISESEKIVPNQWHWHSLAAGTRI
jgi:hypothetical protein